MGKEIKSKDKGDKGDKPRKGNAGGKFAA